uniref:Uncharacterized protein n=1 Tax=Avena sativa TaxID=4498 RepID=A0ACD5Z3W8_AVESA
MLRLRSCNLTHLLPSSSATYPISLVHRLLSTTVPPIPANPAFAVEEYLVETCGLTRAQALKASPRLSHLKSPTKPDAVLAFLAGLGLSGADVAALVAKDPKFLCADVAKTLSPIVAGLSGHGLSQTEIARLVSLGRKIYRSRSVVSMSLFGSIESVSKLSSRLLESNLEKVIKPNAAFLRECGLRDCDISKLCLYTPCLLTTSPDGVRAMVALAEATIAPRGRGSGMFRLALRAVAFLARRRSPPRGST